MQLTSPDIDDDEVKFFSDEQTNILVTVTLVESTLSFLGSLSIVSSYILFYRLRGRRKFSLELVFWLSISDMGSCVSYFIGDPGPGAACTVQAMLMNYFELASILWTTVVALTLFRLIILQTTSSHLLGHFIVYCNAIPLAVTMLPLINGSYGPTGSWCWVTSPGMMR